MKTNSKKIGISLLLLAVLVSPNFNKAVYANSEGTNVEVQPLDDVRDLVKYNDLNTYLKTLNYDEDNILTHNGESITNYFPTYSKFKNGEFIVVEKIKKSISSKNADVSVMTTNDDRIYPGALLKANKGLLENNPTLISLDRAPMNVSINLPGMINGDNTEYVLKPTNSSVRSAINELTDRWHEKYESKYSVPAKMEYTETMVKSKDQLNAQFGLGFEKIGLPLKIDFAALASGEKQACVVNLKQIYYNVSIDAPSQPAKFFDENVSKEDLVSASINEKTPPVYISNVAYGRSMYIKLETSSKSTNVQAAFQALIKGVDISLNPEFKSILDKTNFTAVILGGDAGESSKVVSGKVEDLKRIIEQGSVYNRQNQAVAISYKTSFVKDNAPATFLNNTDYVDTKITSFRDGELVLRHKGAYIAKFFVTWDELSYDKDGNEIYTPKSWEFNGHSRTAGFSTSIQLGGNVRNLNVKIIEKTGLVWEPWRTVYEKRDLPLAKNRTISIWGTTLNPKCSDDVNNN